MSCSRNWHGLFNEKLRQRLTECLDRNARPEPICVDVIVKDWNKTRSVGTYLGEHREDTDFEERPTHGEPIKEVHRWRKRRREKEEGVGRASIIPATDVFAQRFAHVQHGPTFERFEWKSEVLWQMIEAVQGSIRELEMMQSNSDGSTKIGCRYGVVRGDEQYNNVGAPMTTKLVAVYLDNSCLYQIVCASIVAMGYAFVPLHRQWPSRIISEVVEACGAMTVFWSRPTSYHGDGHSKTASRDVPGGLGLPTCAELLPDERSKSPKQIWYSELKCSHASSGELSVSIEHTCRHGAEERDSQMMQHAEVLQRRSPGFSSASEIVSTAYIMRTSGTTQGHASQGKYVVGTIRGILNRIKWFEMEHPSSVGKSLTTDRDVLAFLTPNCFVDHVWQTFASLCSDIQTIAIPLGLYMDDYLLLLAIKEFRISHLVLTPSKWQRLVNARCSVHDAFGSIKVAISSGELLSTHLLKQLKSALHPRCKIMNIYGSTEVSADATCFECSNFYTLEDHLCGAHGWVPVGKPICSTIVALSMQFKTNDRLGDEYLQSSSPGKKQVGMIWCGGIGVCNGYLNLSNNTEMDRSKFAMFRDFGELQAHFDYTIKDNRLDFPAKRSQTPEESSIWMFCMGDLGFIDDSGDLVVIGRADMTTKVGGHFIQIEEIENLLENIEGIVRAFATVVEIEGRSVVAACIVQNDGSNLSESQLQCMCRKLVDMMNFIPEYIFELENLPLTCSGKLDRKLLQKIAMEKVEKQRKLHSTGRVDAILTESEVHAIVAKCLHIVAFEPTESLFDLGANSITIQKIASRLNLSPNQVIDHPTVRRLTKVRENRVALPGQINRQQGSDVNFSRQMKIPLLWKFVSDSCIDVPPCVLGSTVFCCSHKGLVAALHVEDGHVLWTTSLNSTIAGKLGASGSLLVVPRETEIVCLNESNGNILWKKSGLCVAGQSGAYFDEHENIWIGTHNLGLVVLSASTGDIVARHSVDGPISSSTYYPSDIELPDGKRRMCFAATLKGYALGLMYHYDSHTTVPIIVTKWAHSLQDPIFATPVLVDSTRILYLSVKGAVHCFDVISGQVLFKTNEVNDGHHYFLSPIILRDIADRLDACVLIASQQGKLTVLDMHSHHLGIESVPVAQFGSTLLQVASVPGPLKVNRNKLLCTLDSGDLCSLEIVFCDKKWRAQDCSILHSFDSTQSHALCVDCNGHVFAGTRDNTLCTFLFSLSF